MSSVRLSIASYLSADIEALSSFYATIFDLPEVEELRSEIFVGLDVDGVTLGFSDVKAYELLNITDWANPSGTAQYLTFEVETDDVVESLAAKAVELGATMLHDPYETYYGAYQAVLSDLDGNVFRINHFRG